MLHFKPLTPHVLRPIQCSCVTTSFRAAFHWSNPISDESLPITTQCRVSTQIPFDASAEQKIGSECHKAGRCWKKRDKIDHTSHSHSVCSLSVHLQKLSQWIFITGAHVSLLARATFGFQRNYAVECCSRVPFNCAGAAQETLRSLHWMYITLSAPISDLLLIPNSLEMDSQRCKSRRLWWKEIEKCDGGVPPVAKKSGCGFIISSLFVFFGGQLSVSRRTRVGARY
jgi:hypothetical protein